ncbi:MAG: antibiotic biosynthesis monooxygenase [Magnetovibrio sp.]|nr:antibiotic biosynthesis monooxygenase [Magnetovibrio sp.]
MPVTLVHMSINPEYLDEFIEACKTNHLASVQEPGNHRFDFIQNEDDPTKFVFYEWFDSDDDIAAHKQTDHYKTWAATVEDMQSERRYGVRHIPIFPDLKT